MTVLWRYIWGKTRSFSNYPAQLGFCIPPLQVEVELILNTLTCESYLQSDLSFYLRPIDSVAHIFKNYLYKATPMGLNVNKHAGRKLLMSIVAIIWKPVTWISLQITRRWFSFGSDFKLVISVLLIFHNLWEATTAQKNEVFH